MIFKVRVRSFASCLLLLVLVFGCSSDTKHGIVTGMVSFDGQPLKSGNIRFDPADGHSATADAMITDGKFSATVPPGEKRVSITAPKIIGTKKVYETPNSPTVDLTEEMLPKRYNAQSELKVTVKLGNQELPAFDLKSK
jgi:hypothetical protein